MESENLFQQVKKVRVSDTVIEQIMALIEQGVLQVGDKLPGERQLVDQFKVARASVREALRILEFEGIIEVVPGRGIFIINDAPNNSSSEDVVREWFLENASEVLEMLQVREALECKAAHMAAIHAAPEKVEELQKILDGADIAIDERNIDEIVRLDRLFHGKIVDASNNKLLANLVDMVVDALLNPRRSLMRLPGRASVSWEAHRKIYEAIAAGSPKDAEEAMRAHMESVYKTILDFTINDSD